MDKYWKEALKWESLVFATILNPLFCHCFFEKTFGPQDTFTAETLSKFTKTFNICKEQHPDLNSQRSLRPIASGSIKEVSPVYQLFRNDLQTKRVDDLTRYLEGDHPLFPVIKEGYDDQAINPNCIMNWWKVSSCGYDFKFLLHAEHYHPEL